MNPWSRIPTAKEIELWYEQMIGPRGMDISSRLMGEDPKLHDISPDDRSTLARLLMSPDFQPSQGPLAVNTSSGIPFRNRISQGPSANILDVRGNTDPLAALMAELSPEYGNGR